MKGKATIDARAGVRAENAGGRMHREADEQITGAQKTGGRMHRGADEQITGAQMAGGGGEALKNRTDAKSEMQPGAKMTRKQKREWTQMDRYRRLIKERMTALGVYKPQYAALIERTAKLYVKLAALEKKYESSGMEPYIEYTNKAGHTNLIPNPVTKSIEDAYAELMVHERELGLTPAAMRKMGAAAEGPKEKSPLEAALEKVSGG